MSGPLGSREIKKTKVCTVLRDTLYYQNSSVRNVECPQNTVLWKFITNIQGLLQRFWNLNFDSSTTNGSQFDQKHKKQFRFPQSTNTVLTILSVFREAGGCRPFLALFVFVGTLILWPTFCLRKCDSDAVSNTIKPI